MPHPRYFEFTEDEIASRDPLHQRLGELADFLWDDPRPHQEGKFDMAFVASGWDEHKDDAFQALSTCGTAACACGWDYIAHPDQKDLFNFTVRNLSYLVQNWMFAGNWQNFDNSPFGASYRIDHYLKYKDEIIYPKDHMEAMEDYYPWNPFWMEV